MDRYEAVSLGVGGAFSRKRKPPSDSTLGGAVIAPALWGFATPESTYRALLGVPPRSIEQHDQESEPPTEGWGRTKHARCVRPACGCGVSFASFLCPDQRKEGDTPEGKKKPPRGRYLRGASPNINELTTQYSQRSSRTRLASAICSGVKLLGNSSMIRSICSSNHCFEVSCHSSSVIVSS